MLKHAKRINGQLTLPGDKSISHRALMFAACAEGKSTITGLSNGQDVKSTQSCLENIGLVFTTDSNGVVHVDGGISKFKADETTVLDCGNSGTTTRLLMGLLAGLQLPVTFTGDESLCKRPMKRVSEPLALMGAKWHYLKEENKLPLKIEKIEKSEPLKGIQYNLPMASAQVKSALLLAGLSCTENTQVLEPLPSRDHTERMLNAMGCKITQTGKTLELLGRFKDLKPQAFHVPGDISSAAFMLVAASILGESKLTLNNVSLNPSRTPLLECLKQVGVKITTEELGNACGEPYGNIHLESPSRLQGNITLDTDSIPLVIDEIPALTILAMLTDGEFKLSGAEELRHKECDRLQTMANILEKFGFAPKVTQDGYSFTGKADFNFPKDLKDFAFETYHDHRIVMALEILNLRSPYPLNIQGTEWIKISYPSFYEQLNEILV